MTKERFDISSEKGFALIYMAGILTVLLLFAGLAVDAGRAYIVKAQLSKAVDGAALGAARMLNSGDPRGEAERIFKANFPAGYMGTTGADPTAAGNFFSLATVPASGINVVTVNATTTLPTTFMKLANFNDVQISSMGEAQRRMVDLSLVLDVSSSIGSRWGAVRDAARAFVNSFDANGDRVALVTFGNGARVIDQMPSSRGFNKTRVMSDVPNTLPGGSTNMVEGLYRGWDEVRVVPRGQQSGLRIIVLFTDGASNSVPGIYDGSGLARGLRTWDFPDNGADPDNQTHANPQIAGLYDTESGVANPSPGFGQPFAWNCHQGKSLAQILMNQSSGGCTVPAARHLPTSSRHTHFRSSGIPTQFPVQVSSLTINGVAQSSGRGLVNLDPSNNRYPAHVVNINNAARNLIEIIGNAARSDTGGDYPIRIFSIGMGELVRYDLGSLQETSESVLKRIANDATSPDFNSTQLEGKYYFAATPADVGPAFQQLQAQIIRLSK
ncbi:MAG: VWA domain-containing protein [Burkholderiales bacterium]